MILLNGMVTYIKCFIDRVFSHPSRLYISVRRDSHMHAWATYYFYYYYHRHHDHGHSRLLGRRWSRCKDNFMSSYEHSSSRKARVRWDFFPFCSSRKKDMYGLAEQEEAEKRRKNVCSFYAPFSGYI